MDTNKMREVFSDQAFVRSLMDLETATQVQAELKKKGLYLSEQEVIKVRDNIEKHIKNGADTDEMSLDQLDDVAGGVSNIAEFLTTEFLTTELRRDHKIIVPPRW